MVIRSFSYFLLCREVDGDFKAYIVFTGGYTCHHECLSVPTQTILQEPGEFTVTVRDVDDCFRFARISKGRYDISQRM